MPAFHKNIIKSYNSFMQYIESCLLNNSIDMDKESRRRNNERLVNGKYRFLPEEARIIDVLASLIVPSDENTPGTNEMDVMGASAVKALEELVADSQYRQTLYTRGLIALNAVSLRKELREFVDLPNDKQLEILMNMEAGLSARQGAESFRGKLNKKIQVLKQLWRGTYPAIELFPILVRDVKEVFYSSEVSWIWLDYDGPPMPNGYKDLHVSRTRERTIGGQSLRELAASGYGVPGPRNSPRIENPDVVVVGSGAGGGVAAKELAEAGLSIVVLEAGKRFNPLVDYLTDRYDFESKALGVFAPDDYRRDLCTIGGSNGFRYVRVKGVGGSTLRYVAVNPRFHESDFRVRTEDGVAADWPITYQDLEPYYTRVEYMLGVSGPSGPDANPFDPPRSKPFPNPPHPFNLASLAIRRGADKLGLHMVREPLAIPSVDWDGRPACINAGTCTMGCAIGAKSSIDVTYIRAAEKTGRVEVRSGCMAHRITMTPGGKARGVVYFDAEGREHEVSARAIVLAGNAVETPRLLLLSESSRFPDGLANSSGLVGKYFMEHLAVFASGVFPERIDPWRGNPTGGMMQDFYATKKTNSFARGWTILVVNDSNWPLSAAEQLPGWGAGNKRRVERIFAHTTSLCSVGEQLPDIRNRVTLNPDIKDQFGLPVPHITNEPRENDRIMIKAIKSKMKDILEAAGAVEIPTNDHRPGSSAHYFGTCRMGSNPDDSVVNEWGRTHDIPNLFIADGSVFVTGAAVNPALTISSLSTRMSLGLINALKRRDL
jgi:choline dehydrogenase-like flavoprotein